MSAGMRMRGRGYLAALAPVLTRRQPAGVRLDLNELADGPSPDVLAAITAAAGDANRYPDPTAGALVERLAVWCGVDARQVVVGCGAAGLCQQLIQAVCDHRDEVVFGWPSCEIYPALKRVAGARSRSVPLTAAHGLDLEAMLAAITPRTRLIFVCQPNNPTGSAWRRDELAAFIDAVPPIVLVAVDEAYREFVTDPEVADGLDAVIRGWDNVVVVRTFSKAFGLAGLRVGYAIGAPEIVVAVRAVGVPFAVSSVAQAAAVAALDAADTVRACCARVAAERDHVRQALIDAGYAVPVSHANFVWLPLGEHTNGFTEHCRRAGIVVHAVDRFGVRVTIGTPEQNKDFQAVARSYPLLAQLKVAARSEANGRARSLAHAGAS